MKHLEVTTLAPAAFIRSTAQDHRNHKIRGVQTLDLLSGKKRSPRKNRAKHFQLAFPIPTTLCVSLCACMSVECSSVFVCVCLCVCASNYDKMKKLNHSQVKVIHTLRKRREKKGKCVHTCVCVCARVCVCVCVCVWLAPELN